MREILNDWQGLFNCLRPDEPVDLYPVETMEGNSCDFCKSYNGESPNARFVMKDLLTGKIEVVDLCDDCINEDAVFLNKKIIDVTIL